jgi:hypothetical protein
MTTAHASRRLLIGLLLLCAAPPAWAGGECARLEARLADAKTPADHQAIAACFEARAKAARARKAEEAELAADYLGPARLPLLEDTRVAGNALERDAQRWEAMAATQRDLARAAEQPPASDGAAPTPTPEEPSAP